MSGDIAPVVLSPQDEARFWVKVDRGGGADACWPWILRVDKWGYGQFSLSAAKKISSHRLAWMLENGQIPAGMCVCHRCDSARCCNPSHLWLGTTAENTADMDAKGRRSTKLSREDAVTIREEYACGATQSSLAKRFGVTQQAISMIVTGDRWKGGG